MIKIRTMKKYKFDNWDDAIKVLKDDGFLFVSVKHESVTTDSRPIKYLATNKDRKGNRGKIEIGKVINHKDGKVSIQTNLGIAKFFK